MLIIREISSKRDKKKFFKFAIDLYEGNKYFVPVMISDEQEEFDPKHNGAFSYSECKMFLAERNGKVVGRVAAILNKAYNTKINGKQLRFSRFDFIDDYVVSQKLFDAVVSWAKELHMDEIIGPIGFSDLDKQGMLIEGFDELDMYVTTYNYPYYIKHIEKLGLSKKVDWVEYQITIPTVVDERLCNIADMAMERYGYRILEFNKMRQVKKYIFEAMEVLNEAFEKLFGVVWLSKKQMLDYSKVLMMVGNPDYISVVLNKEDKIIGYGFMAPSISRAIQQSKGKLFPFGIFRILRDLKKSKTIDLYSIGVKLEYQNRGVNAIILRKGLQGAIKNNMKICETGPELEDNIEVQSQWKFFERRQHRRRRCYTISI
ncbi:MAG: N-acetyltransferase [Bacteroidales bacterium]|nr:N-acetyltransferase [Bacteroidales bacterium]